MTNPTNVTNPEGDLKLAAMLNGQTVEAKAAVRDWQEAAERVGRLLVESGCVEPSYVAAMKRVLVEMGPYAVIAPGIVLLHARPEDGVKRPCLALVTLSTPVEFGHSENDPVDLVFGLGALDKMAHVHALQQLAQLLGDETALAEIRSCQDAEKLISVISAWSTQ